jgi:hypothetical protein
MNRPYRSILLGALVVTALAGTAVSAAQQDAEERFVAAESAFASGDADAALRMLDELVADTPPARFPDSRWRAAAETRAGEIELALGRADDAAGRFVAVIEGEVTSSWTSRARLGLATTLLWSRDWAAAAPLLQEVVDGFTREDAGADPVAGLLAAARLTLLHRVWLRPAAGGQPWQSAGRYDISAPLERPMGIAAGSNGVLVSDEGRDALVFRDSTGNAASFPIADPQRPWWSDNGDAYVAARATVAAPLSAASLSFTYTAGGRQRAVEDIRAGARGALGEWVLLDHDSKQVLLFDTDRTFLRALDMRNGEPVDLVRGPRGRLFVIEKDRREVMIFAADGSLQGGFAVDTWREPYALAADAAGLVYVLDRDAKRIDVFDPDGGILWTVGPRLPGGVELDDPRDIAVDGSGQILVADRGLGVVVVIQ